ncbi:MAG: hypothetical protein J1E64_01600 [Acetatifactor sp.]|nr:hypothetical protein [Acetatifactor sp.]
MRIVGRKRKREDKRKQHISRVKYAACVTGLLLLIAAAFWMPQAVFAAQNYYQNSRLAMEAVGERKISGFDTGYEHDLKTRMEQFLQGIAAGRQYYAIASDYEMSEAEEKELLTSLPKNEGIWLAQNMTANLISLYVNDLVVEDCKRYAIFDEKFESGIAFSCLYLELSSDLYRSIRILMDLEDDTIYYVKVESAGIGTEMFGMSKGELQDYMDLYGSTTPFYAVANYYGQYYHADNLLVDTGDGMATTRVKMQDLPNYFHKIGEEDFDWTVPIFYGDEALSVDFMMHLMENEFAVEVGLHEIGALVPEFAEE